MVNKAKRELNEYLELWQSSHKLTINEQIHLLSAEINSVTHYAIRQERDGTPPPDEPPRRCTGTMTPLQIAEAEQDGSLEIFSCCDKAGEYNGYGSELPVTFRCPEGCSCHD